METMFVSVNKEVGEREGLVPRRRPRLPKAHLATYCLAALSRSLECPHRLRLII